MKKKTTLIAAIVLFLASSVQVFATSQAAVLFLLISPGARSAGMGESFVAVADDASATFWNSAGLAFQRGSEITFQHCQWLPTLLGPNADMYYEFLAFRHHFESLNGTLGASITFLNMGEMNRTGEYSSDILETFQSWDLAVTIAFGTQLNENLGVGIGMKYIRSNLAPFGAGQEKGDGIGHSFAVDLGVLYRVAFVRGLTVGANLSNMGPKMTYIDASQADPLPTNLKVGLAYLALDSEFNRLQLSIETNKQLVRENDPFYKSIFTAWSDGSIREQMSRLISSAGAEYTYNNMIFLRAGFYYDYEGKVQYPTYGAGLQYSSYRFDFAYVAAEQGHPLADTMRFSLTAAW